MVEEDLVVSNSSPLIALARLGLLDLLGDLWGPVLVPHVVRDELLRKGTADAADIQRAIDAGSVRVRASQAGPNPWPHLGDGEAAAIHLAAQSPSKRLLADDRDARRAALAAGCSVVGTLGFLLHAKQSGRIESVAPLVERLQAADFRIDPRLVNALLLQAGEIEGRSLGSGQSPETVSPRPPIADRSPADG
ncbi:MAG: DUF3368 domain-containing protein [Chloroflexi bacterium]|nr:DUF3368 domain-containing protein [Chloroflexota bacterium]